MSAMSVKTSIAGPPSPSALGQRAVGDRQLLLDEPVRERARGPRAAARRRPPRARPRSPPRRARNSARCAGSRARLRRRTPRRARPDDWGRALSDPIRAGGVGASRRLPCSSSPATASGASHIGTCPAPGSATLRTVGGRCAGRATSRSCSGHASVTGTRRCSRRVKRPARIARLTASKPGRVGVGAHEPQRRLGRDALGVGDRAGEREPAARGAADERGQPRRRSPSRAPRAIPRFGASGSGHSPAGAIAVTERAWPAAASSSATQPPSELPATWYGLVRQRRRRSRRRAPRASAARSPFSAGDSPKPGRSTAITSRSAVSRSITGAHTCRSAPSGCRSTSTGPDPARS